MSFVEGEITVEFGGTVGPAGPAGNAVPIAAGTTLANPSGVIANPVGVDAAGMRTLIGVSEVFVADQIQFAGSFAYGTGLRDLDHVTGEDGYDNIAIGKDSGLDLTTGRANVLIGTNCGRYMTSSSIGNSYDGGGLGNTGNTFVGRSAGGAAGGTMDGGALDNTCIGINCGQNLTSAMDNAAMGANALRSIGGGSENVSIGHGTLQHLVGSGNFTTGTGHRNTAVGDLAGRLLNTSSEKTGGKSSVYLGSRTRSASNTAVNEIVIGYDMDGAGSNTVSIGNSSIERTILRGTVEIGGNATTRLLSVAGVLYIESDSSIEMRDTSSAATNWLMTNDGRTFLKAGVNHADLEGTPRLLYGAGGTPTTLYGRVNTTGPLHQVVSGSSVSLSTNGELAIEMTSNTAGSIVYRGSDGTTRRFGFTVS